MSGWCLLHPDVRHLFNLWLVVRFYFGALVWVVAFWSWWRGHQLRVFLAQSKSLVVLIILCHCRLMTGFAVRRPAHVLFLHPLHVLAVLQAQLFTESFILLSHHPFSLTHDVLHVDLLLLRRQVRDVAFLRCCNPRMRLSANFPRQTCFALVCNLLLAILYDFSNVFSSCSNHFHKVPSFNLCFFFLVQLGSCSHYLLLFFLYPTAFICNPLVFCYFLSSHSSCLFNLVFALFSHLLDSLSVKVRLLLESLKLSMLFIDLSGLLVKILFGLFFLFLSFTFLDELFSCLFLVSNELSCLPLFLISFLLFFFKLFICQLLTQ